MGFLLPSVFVSLFNYVDHRLTTETLGLSQAAIDVFSLTYRLGMLGSGVVGAAADHWRPRLSLLAGLAAMGVGVSITLSSVPVVLCGVGPATAGHVVARAAANG